MCTISPNRCICDAGRTVLPGATGGARELDNPIYLFRVWRSPWSRRVGHEGRGVGQSGDKELAREQAGGTNADQSTDGTEESTRTKYPYRYDVPVFSTRCLPSQISE